MDGAPPPGARPSLRCERSGLQRPARSTCTWQYLTRWRMQIAARLLAEGTRKVAAVAFEVGYDSEAAFSRAFRKAAGVPPARWRQQQAIGAAR